MTTLREAAAELRRLHAECEHHKAWVAHITAENKSLEAQRDALLEALKELMVAADGVNAGPQTWLTRARAAIKAAEEKQPLYTAPPQRRPLTEEEISNIWDGHIVPVFGKNGINPIVFARAIEAKHGIGGQQ